MAKLSKDDILKAVEEMSVLELADLVKALEKKFGVTTGAPVVVAPPAANGQAQEGPKEEQTVFNVMLADAGAQKIQVIKVVRELVPTLGLTDAKALVDSAPKEVLSGVNKTAAEEAKKKLEVAGAKVELK
ncbi:50S ribosomal protein L7/L12 [Candidatus Gottesmanbacteria bacterium]|nr:50S ribosomal protein L7/L12 [Candidatus Gottesmanbacteria bacterium]